MIAVHADSYVHFQGEMLKNVPKYNSIVSTTAKTICDIIRKKVINLSR